MIKILTSVLIVIFLVTAFSAFAANIVVDDASDLPTMTSCTLRNAITSAESGTANGTCSAGSGTDTITFSISASAINLTSFLPLITTTMIIDGTGQSITVDGSSSNQIFDVRGGNLTVNSLTIRNGSGTTGGGIFNTGILTITNSTIRDNTAVSGGGIYNTGTLAVTNNNIFGNSASSTNGGGIYNTGTVTITSSTISNNSANNSVGGGIYNDASTIIGITNSTFSGNMATSGAGIYNTGPITSIANSTFSGNSSTSGAGGIFNNGAATITTLANTIIAHNIGGNCAGTLPSSTNSNLTDIEGCWGVATTFLEAHLGLLASNGGPTQTMALLAPAATNPAINTGDTTTCSNAPVSGKDQRGVNRPQGSGCDIGAYEYVESDVESEFPWPVFGPATQGIRK